MDLDNVLNAAATTTKKKKKSDLPIVELTDDSLVTLAEQWLDAAQSMDTQKAIKTAAEEGLIDHLREIHAEHCNKIGKVPATVRVVLPSGTEFKVDLAKSQYAKIPQDSWDELEAIFGEKTGLMFSKEMAISLTAEALKDSQILIKLVKAVGEENFSRYFKVERTLKPTDRLHTGRFTDEVISESYEQAADAGLVTPYKASFKK
jgi:hypothetical protein